MHLTVEEVSGLDRDAFVQQFGSLFEHSPWVAGRAWRRRPFGSVDDLERAFTSTVFSATEDEQLSLIRSYPDLAGSEAAEGTLTSESVDEHASAGLDRLTSGEHERLERLNAAYRKRFEIPLVFCSREHTKESILAEGEGRLAHGRAEELRTALGEIAKIGRLRLLDRVRPSEEAIR